MVAFCFRVMVLCLCSCCVSVLGCCVFLWRFCLTFWLFCVSKLFVFSKKRNKVCARALMKWLVLQIGWNNMNALQGFKLVVHWATHKTYLNNYWRSDSCTRLNHPCSPIIQISTCISFCWWWEDNWLSGWLLMYIYITFYLWSKKQSLIHYKLLLCSSSRHLSVSKQGLCLSLPH